MFLKKIVSLQSKNSNDFSWKQLKNEQPALNELLPEQKNDFLPNLSCYGGRAVTIRLFRSAFA